MVFFFFSDPSRAYKIRFCVDIWLLSNSLLANFVSASFVLGLPGFFAGGCCCCGEMFATRFRFFFFPVSCFFMREMSLRATGVAGGSGEMGGGGGGGDGVGCGCGEQISVGGKLVSSGGGEIDADDVEDVGEFTELRIGSIGSMFRSCCISSSR